MNEERSLLQDIKEGRRMSSVYFALNEHCVRQGDSPLDLWDFEQMEPKNGWRYVGWAPSASTPVPNSNWGKNYPIAVLLENYNGERSWCHVPATPILISAAFGLYGW